MSTNEKRIDLALQMAARFGTNDGADQKQWVIDQMVRALTGGELDPKYANHTNGFKAVLPSEDYRKWVRETQNGEDGPNTYEWDVGIAP